MVAIKKHKWVKIIAHDTHTVMYKCRNCKQWRLSGEVSSKECKGVSND